MELKRSLIARGEKTSHVRKKLPPKTYTYTHTLSCSCHVQFVISASHHRDNSKTNPLVVELLRIVKYSNAAGSPRESLIGVNRMTESQAPSSLLSFSFHRTAADNGLTKCAFRKENNHALWEIHTHAEGERHAKTCVRKRFTPLPIQCCCFSRKQGRQVK